MAKRVVSVPLIFNYVRFGTTIYINRNDLKMTQADVATLVGMDDSTVSNYEMGEENMKMQHFLAFCNVFDLDPRDFFELEM